MFHTIFLIEWKWDCNVRVHPFKGDFVLWFDRFDALTKFDSADSMFDRIFPSVGVRSYERIIGRELAPATSGLPASG